VFPNLDVHIFEMPESGFTELVNEQDSYLNRNLQD